MGNIDMKELLVYMIRQLVDNPDEVTVDEIPSENAAGVAETTLEVRVAKEDMGKVIGRQGRIAKELRTIMRSAANHADRRVNVEIIG